MRVCSKRAAVCGAQIGYLISALGATLAFAQITPGAGLSVRTIDGAESIGTQMAFARVGTSDQWAGFFYSNAGRLVSAECSAFRCSSSGTVSAAGSNRGVAPSAVARRELDGGLPLVSYYDATNQDLVIANCLENEFCPTATERTLDSTGNVGSHSSMAIRASDGLAFLSYYDQSNQDLKLYRCADVNCTTGTATSLLQTGDAGRVSSASFVGDTLLIAYELTSSNQVWLLTANAPNYTISSNVNLAPGAQPVISVDGTGFPEVVYAGLDGSLRLVDCSSVTCAAGTSLRTLGAAGSFSTPSVARFSDNLMLITRSNATSLRATVCNNAACDAPAERVLDASRGGGMSYVAASSEDAIVSFYTDQAVTASVRVAGCSDASCTQTINNLALNGYTTFNPRIVLRSGNLPMIAYQRREGNLRPYLAMCSDDACNAINRRMLNSQASTTPPSIALRTDQRALVYYGNGSGGTTLESCNDGACNSHSSRNITAAGTSTEGFAQIAIRGTDLRPVLAYVDSINNDVYLYLCADSNCSTGTARLAADELTNVQILQMNVIVDASNRPVVIYNTVGANNAYLTKYLRCSDADCATVSTRNIGAIPTNFALPLALRSDGRVAFLESDNVLNYVVCSDADCTTQTRSLIGSADQLSPNYSLSLSATDLPSFDVSGVSRARIASCSTSTCTGSITIRDALTDSLTNNDYSGSLRLGSDGNAVACFSDEQRNDVVIVLPPRATIFGNGFE